MVDKTDKLSHMFLLFISAAVCGASLGIIPILEDLWIMILVISITGIMLGYIDAAIQARVHSLKHIFNWWNPFVNPSRSLFSRFGDLQNRPRSSSCTTSPSVSALSSRHWLSDHFLKIQTKEFATQEAIRKHATVLAIKISSWLHIWSEWPLCWQRQLWFSGCFVLISSKESKESYLNTVYFICDFWQTVRHCKIY